MRNQACCRRDAGPEASSDVATDAERDFEARLVESSTLAFRVAFSVLRHHQDAEDVAQDAFLKAHRRFDSLRDRDRFRAWLIRMTWRLALDRRRGDRRRNAREQAWPPAPGAPGATASLIERERAERLWAAIDDLPEKLRLALVLATIEGHDLAETARLLDLPEGTVKSRLFLARRRLKERLSWMNRSTR
jgi:RNA polymerase sigma-70 factor (ECF subfamily)